MSMSRTITLIAFAFILACIAGLLPAENWPGYEGLRHQSASPVDLAGTIQVAWQKHYTDLIFIPGQTASSRTSRSDTR